MGRQCLPQHEAAWLPSLRPGQSDWRQLLESLARLHVSGVSVDWPQFYQEHAQQRVVLPTYPFERRSYPLQPGLGVVRQAASPATDTNATHPLRGRQLAARQPSPSEVAVAEELWARLLRGLPEHHRQILELRRDGNTHQQIADRLGLNERTVRRVIGSILHE